MSDKKISSIRASNYTVTPFLDYYGTKTRVEFSESCLKQDKITYTHGKVVNIYIVYEMKKSVKISDIQHLKFVYLGQLVWLKIQTLTSMDILDMELDLIDMKFFRFLALD